jgi:alpha-galactosidase
VAVVFLAAGVGAWAARACVIDRARAGGVAGESWQHQEVPAVTTTKLETATATRLRGATEADGFPQESAWQASAPVRFRADWQGKNADEQRETEVRLLWTPETLYLRFAAKYRVLNVFPDAEVDGRRDHLWQRDVCEAFLQADPTQMRTYKEIEVAPNGMWIELDIAPGAKHELRGNMRRRVNVDKDEKRWVAVVSLPIGSITAKFDATAKWRANFYRVEGETEPRFYSAWQPTNTPQPQFHVPEAFGWLAFAE